MKVTDCGIIDLKIKCRGVFESYEKKTKQKNTERDIHCNDDTCVIHDDPYSCDQHMGEYRFRTEGT